MSVRSSRLLRVGPSAMAIAAIFLTGCSSGKAGGSSGTPSAPTSSVTGSTEQPASPTASRTESSATPTASGSPSTATTAGITGTSGNQQGQTRLVTGTALGDVEVPVNPTRIVALWNVAPQLLELGVKPLGALPDEIDPQYLSPSLLPNAADAVDLGDAMDLRYEQILALQPDLIVTMLTDGLTIDTDKLTQIAPTLAWNVSDPLDVWALYPTMADAIGRTAEYEAAKAGVDDKISAIKSEFGDAIAGKKAAFVQSYDAGSYELQTNTSLINERAAAVGFLDISLTDHAKKGEDSRLLEQSLEDLPSLDEADVIFYEADSNGSPAGAIPDLLAEPAFTALPAAQAGLALPLRQFSEYTYAAAMLQLDDLAAAGARLSEG